MSTGKLNPTQMDLKKNKWSAPFKNSLARTLTHTHILTHTHAHARTPTEQLQRIIRHLTQPVHDNFRCHLCDQIVSTSWLLHICSSHTVSLHSNNLCEQDILDLLIKEHDDIFSIIFPK